MILDLTIIVPIIIGLTEILKRAGWLNSRYVPLLAVFFGLSFAMWVGGPEAWLDGIIAGLTASGLWDISKKTILGK